MFRSRKYFKSINFYFLILIILLSNLKLFSQNGVKKLYPSLYQKMQYEIGKIDFIGNESFSYGELMGVISSKPSEIGIMRYFYEEVNKNKSAPKLLKQSFRKILGPISENIPYYNKIQAVSDVESLWNFYNKHGFHDAVIEYNFSADTNKNINVLTFIIKENQAYHLSCINYLGLDSLTPDVIEKINNSKLLSLILHLMKV